METAATIAILCMIVVVAVTHFDENALRSIMRYAAGRIYYLQAMRRVRVEVIQRRKQVIDNSCDHLNQATERELKGVCNAING